MHVRIQIDPKKYVTILTGRGAIRRLLINGTRSPIGNCILVRCVGQIAPGVVHCAPLVIGHYGMPIGGQTGEIFQVSSVEIGEYFRDGGDWFKCIHNETITATEYTPAITEFVGIYGDVRRSDRGGNG